MDKDNKDKQNNPYLMLGFWEFAIMSTLMTVFFPWSLLFCVVFYGLTETKYIVVALIHDAVQTIIAVLSILTIIGFSIGILIAIFSVLF